MAGHRLISLIFVFIFSIAYANIVPNEEIGKNSIEIKLLKTEMQSVVQTIVRFSFLLNTKLMFTSDFGGGNFFWWLKLLFIPLQSTKAKFTMQRPYLQVLIKYQSNFSYSKTLKLVQMMVFLN